MLYIPLPFFTQKRINPLFIQVFIRGKKEFHLKIVNNETNFKKIKIYFVDNNQDKNEMVFEDKFCIKNDLDYYLFFDYLKQNKTLTIKIIEYSLLPLEVNQEAIFKNIKMNIRDGKSPLEKELVNFTTNCEKIQQFETNFTKMNDYSQLLSTEFYEKFLLNKLLLANQSVLKRYLELRDTLVYYNLKTFFHRCYHSNYGKNFNYLLKDKQKEEINKLDFKLPKKFATFIMCVKNRAERAKLSILSALEHAEYFDFIIVEDQSDNLIKLDEIKHKNKNQIQYYLLDLQVPWSRSALLNYGIRKAKTPYVLMWDVDFLFSSFFGKELYNLMNKIDPNKFFVQISLFETEFNFKTSQFYKLCDPYSSVWIYPREQLEKIFGFNDL